ncbi:hypothetical protein [Winogradskyella poriferorum]|uniref:hypothetical protein n=1 Tax=Winogradskyella poriferorum TaxID=307627 RepID=UPI003D660867
MHKVLKRLRRLSYLLITAWMLGISNVILEEVRMVHDTRAVIEQQEEVSDTDFDDDKLFL